jgi:hypothetical protein
VPRSHHCAGPASAPSFPEEKEKHLSRTPRAAPDEHFMTEKEAAALLSMSVRSLQGFRYRGGGPRYCKFGRSVRYTRADLITWARTSRRNSTSDPGPRSEPGEEDAAADPADLSEAEEDSTPDDADLLQATQPVMTL